MYKKVKTVRAFTLVELLIVMAIMGFLMALSVAGLQYALRRSRDNQRQSAVTNLDNALTAYYTDNQEYPTEDGTGNPLSTSDTVATPNDPVGEGLVDTVLGGYMQGAWDAGPMADDEATQIGYYINSDGVNYAVCAVQENGSGTYGDYKGCFCKGTLTETIDCDSLGSAGGTT